MRTPTPIGSPMSCIKIDYCGANLYSRDLHCQASLKLIYVASLKQYASLNTLTVFREAT